MNIGWKSGPVRLGTESTHRVVGGLVEEASGGRIDPWFVRGVGIEVAVVPFTYDILGGERASFFFFFGAALWVGCATQAHHAKVSLASTRKASIDEKEKIPPRGHLR